MHVSNLGPGRDFATINGRGRTWRGLRRFGTPGAFHRLNQRLEGATSLFAIDRPRWPEHNLLASPLEEQFSYRSECDTPEATFTHAAAVPGLRAALRKVHVLEGAHENLYPREIPAHIQAAFHGNHAAVFLRDRWTVEPTGFGNPGCLSFGG